MSVVVLSGGVGGAKLVDGLARVCAPGELTAIVNTGDDFTHVGLYVAPDIDSVFYLLTGRSDEDRGWGVADESWNFMDALGQLGGPDWFSLGDRDLAMHVLRTRALAEERSLSAYTASIVTQAGLSLELLPMTDDRVATIVETDHGTLPFQSYFVKHRCEPVAHGIRFEGAEEATPAPDAINAIREADSILIAPSNPFLSVDPILAVPGIATALAEAAAPVVAVSPLVGGHAVKGPTEKLMREFGLDVSDIAIAAHYAGWLDAMLVDEATRGGRPSCAYATADTMMRTADDRARVARAALALAASL